MKVFSIYESEKLLGKRYIRLNFIYVIQNIILIYQQVNHTYEIFSGDQIIFKFFY